MSIAEKINKIVNPEWSGTAVHEGTRTAESVLGEISAQLSRGCGQLVTGWDWHALTWKESLFRLALKFSHEFATGSVRDRL